MRTGRPRKPTALKIMHGTARKDRANPEEPQLAAPDITKPPKGMTRGAKAEWKRLASELVTAGVLTVGDVKVFQRYCEIVAKVEAYERMIRKVGIENSHSLGYANYLIKLQLQQKQYSETLGLTPSSRSGVKATKKSKDEDSAFLFGKSG